jgi:hypothetical protein
MTRTNPIVEIHILTTTFNPDTVTRQELMDRMYAIREVVVEAMNDEIGGES